MGPLPGVITPVIQWEHHSTDPYRGTFTGVIT